MATDTSTILALSGRLLQNDPSIAGEVVEDSDDLVNEDGSAVIISPSGVKYEVSVQTGLRNFKYPVHENLTIAAAIRSKSFNSNGSWTNMRLEFLPLEKYELIRGVFFNDDPNCTLFEDKTNNNRSMSLLLGLAYVKDFGLASAGLMDHANMLYRSHFGNLQFVHAMGSSVGETPQDTQAKVKLWLQSMYSVYSGQDGVRPDSPIKATGLRKFFEGSDMTFTQLLMARTPSYKDRNIPLRALGSCLHVVQDSFAKGHCRRDENGTGAIANFHCYSGQDHSAHSHADADGGAALEPQNLNSFDNLYGGRKCVDRCVEFLEAATSKLPWSAKLEKWFQNTFAISPSATNSDTSV